MNSRDPTQKQSIRDLPLCVDLDGTLISTDMFQELIAALFRYNPFLLVLIPLWLLRGKAFVKRRILEITEPDISNLPINESVYQFVKSEYQRGREVILVTATDEILASRIAAQFKCFTQVVGSDGKVNCAGPNKAAKLMELYPGGFEYFGNSRVDFHVWRAASGVLAVNPSQRFLNRVSAQFPGASIFPANQARFTDLLKALRIHQWVKNLLLFVPLVLSHKFLDPVLGPAHSVPVLVAFLSFSLCASSVYLLNDIIDLAGDREHRSKRNRPFAAGRLSLAFGFIAAPLLFLLGLSVGALVSANFLAILVLYLTLTVIYSFIIKRLLLLDIVLLASLYAIRVFAGGLAANVEVSEWLMAFCVFFFFSLAALKRAVELKSAAPEPARSSDILPSATQISGRGYQTGDLAQIQIFGSASGLIGVLVAALYITSHEVSKLYSRPELIWLLVPLLMYWITRIWLLAERDGVDDDPIVFAIRDRVSHIVLLCAVAVLLFAR